MEEQLFWIQRTSGFSVIVRSFDTDSSRSNVKTMGP